MKEFTLTFTPPNRYPSECLITVYPKSAIEVATDTDTGTSRYAGAVTNACAIIAGAVAKRLNLNPRRMIFIEQYYPGQPIQTTDLVRFSFSDSIPGQDVGISSPDWMHIPTEDFNLMISIANDIEAMYAV